MAVLSRASLRDQRFHDLRHAAATLMLRDGLPVHEVSSVLGHSQTSTTLNVYTHVLPGGNDRAAAAMDQLFGLIRRLSPAHGQVVALDADFEVGGGGPAPGQIGLPEENIQ